MDDHADPHAALHKLARACGVSSSWIDHSGRERHVAAHDLKAILHALGVACGSDREIAQGCEAALRASAVRTLPTMIVADVGEPVLIPADGIEPQHGVIRFEDGDEYAVPLHEHADGFLRLEPLHRLGYHRLHIGDTDTTLAVAPQRCFTASDMAAGAPVWGVTAQLYALRTTGDGGIGTFAGVEALALSAAANGADALALSPAHALFSADPLHFSPYSPSTRLFKNPAHADLASVFGPSRVAHAISCADAAAEMSSLEALSLVDWAHAAAVRLRVLDALFDDVLRDGSENPLSLAFARFCCDSGEALRDHARFEALHAHYFGRDFTRWDWRTWAPEHHSPTSPAVAHFARDHERAIRFHMFLQWVADASQEIVQQAALRAGMRIGLIGDLAVGMNAGGSHAWSRPGDLLNGLSVGAPPDALAPRGQNWGLTTFSPKALRASGYAPFIATLRAMFRHAGGVRIDHVMGLARLWVMPEGVDASHGAYITYPLNDLLKLVRLESQRHRAIVIGEDLGTVPHGLRDRLEHAGVYGMRVMQFERDGATFRKKEWYTPAAAAMTSTHDLPTLAGWWSGEDLRARDALDQFGPHQSRAEEEETRAHDRTALWQAFEDAGATETSQPANHQTDVVLDAAAEFLARSNAQLALIPVEDLIGAQEQPNLPGTTVQHPNWRRRYDGDARRMLDGAARGRVSAFARARPRRM